MRDTDPPGGPGSEATPLFLTADGRATLEARVEELQEVAAGLLDAVEGGDADDTTIANCQRALDETARLTTALAHARTVEELAEDPAVVLLGDTITIRFDDDTEETYIVVHPLEASLDDQRISSESPVARAVLGRRVGDEVEVAAPAGAYRCTVVRAERY